MNGTAASTPALSDSLCQISSISQIGSSCRSVGRLLNHLDLVLILSVQYSGYLLLLHWCHNNQLFCIIQIDDYQLKK